MKHLESMAFISLKKSTNFAHGQSGTAIASKF